MDKKKIIIIAVIIFAIVVAIIVGGYIYLRGGTSQAPSAATPLESAMEAGSVVASSATQGVLPSIGDATNPLQNKPDVNPIDTANPFRLIQTNPFQ